MKITNKIFLYAIIIYIVAYIIYIIASKYVYNEGQDFYELFDTNNNGTILDSGFQLVSDKRDNKNLYIIKESISILIVSFFVIYLFKYNKILLSEFIMTYSIILVLKSILFSGTILPDPSEKCSKYNIFKPHKGSCHDLIISSHCSLLFIILIMVFKYNLLGHHKYILLGFILFIIFSILSLRQHYTIDIINAFIYSFFINYFIAKFINNLNVTNIQ